MKLTRRILVLFFALLLSSCEDSRSNKDSSSASGSDSPKQIVDYSSCPYIGYRSHYFVSSGQGDYYKTMQFIFEYDGIGTWGITNIVNGETKVESHPFHYSLVGDVNIYWVENDTSERGSGFFTTDSSGQVFVCEGMHFYRIN